MNKPVVTRREKSGERNKIKRIKRYKLPGIK